jgi:hypothetical protein
LHISPWFDPASYWPFGYALTHGELTLSNTLPGLAITMVFGPITAYNFAVVLSFVLTAAATYAWAYRLTGSRGAALVAAVIAEMAPYRLGRVPGHLGVITTQWFSCALWTFEEYRRSILSQVPARPGRWAVALAVSLALVALSSWYSAYQVALIFPLYVLLRTPRTRELWHSRRWWTGLLAAAAVCLALALPAALPYARAARSGGLDRQFKEANYWSLNFYDFLIPNADHPLLNARMRVWFPQETSEWPGRAVSLGYVAMALAIIALLRRRHSATDALPAIVTVAVVTAFIALGPMLHSGDRPVFVPMPYPVMKTVDWLFFKFRPSSVYRAPLWIHQETWIPLPSLFLWLFVPASTAMRVLSRFGYWTLLMTAALAALGTRALAVSRGANTRAAIALLLTLAIVFESWSVKTVTRWEPRPVDLWVSRLPADDVVIELPLVDALRAGQDYYVTVQQHRTVLGPRGDSYQPAVLGERARVLERLPSDAALAALRSWGATIVIVHSEWAKRWPEWEGMFARAHVKEAARFGETRVYRLNQ